MNLTDPFPIGQRADGTDIVLGGHADGTAITLGGKSDLTGQILDALPGLEPLPAYVPPRPSYVSQFAPVPAPAVEWAAAQWAEPGGAPGDPARRWRRRNDTNAVNGDGTATRTVAELDAMAAAGAVNVIEVIGLSALVREALALRAAAVYRWGYHEDGDECDGYNDKTGECPCVTAYVATTADARLRYDVAELLDLHTQLGPGDPDELADLRDLVAGLKAALAGERD